MTLLAVNRLHPMRLRFGPEPAPFQDRSSVLYSGWLLDRIACGVIKVGKEAISRGLRLLR